MKVKLLKSDSTETKIIVDGVTASFVNALRRACSFEVPTLAIENVYFTKNSSALYDEIIAHRVGLIPLKTDLKIYELAEKCSCKDKGCVKCQVPFKLSVTGPAMVYSKELKSKDLSVAPVYSNIPIVELVDAQELEFEAVAVVGQGKTHIKWSPCLAYYHSYPKSKVKGSAAKALKNVPKGLFDSNGNIADLSNYDLCQHYAEKSGGAIVMETEANKFIFTVEPWGQIPPKKILKEASQIIQQKVKDIRIK